MGNFAVFASGIVGLEVIKLFSDCEERLKLVVLDHDDFKGMNHIIIDTVKRYNGVILRYYNELDIDEVKNQQLDLGILAWWRYRIKPPLLGLPRVGFLNTHPSYLPFCKGKHPNFWAIVDNEPFGVTLHMIDSNLDSGPILFQKEIDYSWEDTGESLYNKSIEAMCKLLNESKAEILNLSMNPKSQNDNEGSFHWAKEIDEYCLIDLDKEYKARDLLNLIRARTFKPYPAACFYENNDVFDVRIEITKR